MRHHILGTHSSIVITKTWPGWDIYRTTVQASAKDSKITGCLILNWPWYNLMAAPHIFQMVVFHISCREPRIWLSRYKRGPKWRKQILRWRVDHECHGNLNQIHLRGEIDKTYIIYIDVITLLFSSSHHNVLYTKLLVTTMCISCNFLLKLRTLT